MDNFHKNCPQFGKDNYLGYNKKSKGLFLMKHPVVSDAHYEYKNEKIHNDNILRIFLGYRVRTGLM